MIVTIAFTRDEGHVLRLGGVRRVRKIFAGCPAIRPIWDQSPRRSASRFETVGNRLYPSHGQNSLCRSAAEAKIQDRSRAKTGLNTAPGFSRVKYPFREAQTTDDGARKPKRPQTNRGDARAGRNPEKNKARRQSIPSSPLPRWERARVRVTPQTQTPTVIPAHSHVIPAEAGTQRKTKHAIHPFRADGNPGLGDTAASHRR